MLEDPDLEPFVIPVKNTEQHLNLFKQSDSVWRAKEFLSTAMYSVSDVAYLSGFHDEAYFGREFKKASSVSPAKYKEKGRVSISDFSLN